MGQRRRAFEKAFGAPPSLPKVVATHYKVMFRTWQDAVLHKGELTQELQVYGKLQLVFTVIVQVLFTAGNIYIYHRQFAAHQHVIKFGSLLPATASSLFNLYS